MVAYSCVVTLLQLTPRPFVLTAMCNILTGVGASVGCPLCKIWSGNTYLRTNAVLYIHAHVPKNPQHIPAYDPLPRCEQCSITTAVLESL